jgi:hypothetical protein
MVNTLHHPHSFHTTPANAHSHFERNVLDSIILDARRNRQRTHLLALSSSENKGKLPASGMGGNRQRITISPSNAHQPTNSPHARIRVTRPGRRLPRLAPPSRAPTDHDPLPLVSAAHPAACPSESTPQPAGQPPPATARRAWATATAGAAAAAAGASRSGRARRRPGSRRAS